MIGVSLAHVYRPDKDDVTGWLVEPKLDGVRCVLHRGQAWTRAGKPIPSVADLAAHFADLPFALDGELMLPGAKFEETVGEVRQTRYVSERLVYHVFDVIVPSQTPFDCRRYLLCQTLNHSNWRHQRVTRTACGTLGDPHVAIAQALEAGYEGIMLKDPAAPYRPGRSRSVLKMKPWHDCNATVVEALPGEGKHLGRMGALVVETEDGVRCKVGTGFSDEQRAVTYPPGTVVEITYQERTARGALRFPTFRRVRSDL